MTSLARLPCRHVASPGPWVSTSLAACATAFTSLSNLSSREDRRRKCWTHATHASSQPHTAQPAEQQRAGRRAVLLAGTAAVLTTAVRGPAVQAETQELSVGPGQEFATIGAAVAAANPGDTVRVLPDRYRERLVLDRPITLVGDPDNPSAVELVWETQEPYQPAIFCAADGVMVRGFTIRHRSPSIADNYAVQIQDCSAALDSCDISSATGSGVGCEGGSPQLYRCTVHNCERHGVAIFGGLDGSRSSGVVEGCEVAYNRGNGVMVRGGATPAITDTTIVRNGGYGLYLQDCGGSYSRNTVVENKEGAVGHLLVFEEFDVSLLYVDNKIDRFPQRLTPLRK